MVFLTVRGKNGQLQAQEVMNMSSLWPPESTVGLPFIRSGLHLYQEASNQSYVLLSGEVWLVGWYDSEQLGMYLENILRGYC